jgi:hypothetical protein
MTTEAAPKGRSLLGILMLLVAFLGLCTTFVSVVTAAQAWQELAQARWPEVAAHVDRCDLDRTSTAQRKILHIPCRLSYAIDAEQNVANVYPSSVPWREIWRYPPHQIAPFDEWVDEHAQGTALVVRYDPADHKKVVLVTTDMPRGGPRTPNNVKLLEVCAGSFLALLAIAQLTRPRPQSLWLRRRFEPAGVTAQVRSRAHLPGDGVYRREFSKFLKNVTRDYQPIWRIRSKISPL